VLDAGHAGDLLDLLAVLAPCAMGYGEIDAHLTAMKISDTYGGWIYTYASADDQRLCHDVGVLIDGAVARRIAVDAAASPRWASLPARFAMATQLEIGTWHMGLDP